MFNGVGTWFYADGSKMEGVWKDDSMIYDDINMDIVGNMKKSLLSNEELLLINLKNSIC